MHAPSIIASQLAQGERLGHLDAKTMPKEWLKPPPEVTPEAQIHEKPLLSSIINSYDFEEVAEQTLSKKTWAFYSSAATDGITHEANKRLLDSIWFRPRLLRDVSAINLGSRMLGFHLKMPLFVSPAALAKLVHKDGEVALAKAAHAKGIVQLVGAHASAELK